jgi:hypothetical protein
MQDNYIYVVKKTSSSWIYEKKVPFCEQTFLITKFSLAPKTKTIFVFLSVSCKSWRPQHSRIPWHYKCINEFEEEIIFGTQTMQFHCPLKLLLFLHFLTQNHFCRENKKITIPNDLHHKKAVTKKILLSLVLTCQYFDLGVRIFSTQPPYDAHILQGLLYK